MSTAPTEKPKKVWRKRHLFPRTLANIVDTITTPMLDGDQRMLRLIIKDWPAIVGGDIASFCAPQKLQFPNNQNTNGILHVRVAAHKAPEIPYMSPQIIEALARHIGFRAIGRIVVDPVHKE